MRILLIPILLSGLVAWRPCLTQESLPSAIARPITVDWKNEGAFRVSIVLPDGMAARVELPAAEGTSGVTRDGDQVAATRKGDRWIVTEEFRGAVTLTVQ